MFEHIEEKEAVEKAALIEKNGFTFYSLLAAKTEDAEAAAVFKRLAKDEEKHLKIIEKKYFPEAGFGELITEEELEVEEYVRTRGVPDLFTRRIDIEKLVHAIDEPRKALLIALDAEVHSVEFFTKLAEKSSTEEGREICLELAEEERQHVEHIEELLKSTLK
ncbi:MAG: ferritin family protein [Thermodesulfobacteriota bacterium]